MLARAERAMSTQARQIALQGAIRLSNRSSVPTPTPTSCATSSNAALSGGSNRATALSLNACPYFANSFSHHRPRFIDSIGATSILTRGGVKTDRRDSLMLARLHRAGELTAVWVPDDAQEGLRDLTRAREDMKHLQRQAKQRLCAFLLRYGKCYSGKSNWTQAHYRWLEEQQFGHSVQQIVFQEYVDTVKALSKRVDGLDAQLESAASESVFWPVIQGLMALRGVNLLTATTVVAEIGDLKRFASAPQLMAYLGLVPSEHSSGATKSRGAITKTGNAHVRRVLVEASWTYRHPARKTTHLQRRAERTSEAVQDIAWKAQKRLCARYRLMEGKGKLKVQACTAVARELTGFIWAIGQELPQPVPNR